MSSRPANIGLLGPPGGRAQPLLHEQPLLFTGLGPCRHHHFLGVPRSRFRKLCFTRPRGTLSGSIQPAPAGCQAPSTQFLCCLFKISTAPPTASSHTPSPIHHLKSTFRYTEYHSLKGSRAGSSSPCPASCQGGTRPTPYKASTQEILLWFAEQPAALTFLLEQWDRLPRAGSPSSELPNLCQTHNPPKG